MSGADRRADRRAARDRAHKATPPLPMARQHRGPGGGGGGGGGGLVEGTDGLVEHERRRAVLPQPVVHAPAIPPPSPLPPAAPATRERLRVPSRRPPPAARVSPPPGGNGLAAAGTVLRPPADGQGRGGLPMPEDWPRIPQH